MLLRGKYRLGDRIGAGAMAAVFAGTHVVTERPIAVKRLLPDRVRDDKALARFEREARAAGRIRSEHVVEVLDYDRDEQGLPFLVLERLFGETLAERLRKRPPLGALEAIDLAAQALVGVADMHRVGVIHRDIKPSNVFLCSAGSGVPLVKLVDFGVAKLADEPAAHLTHVDEMLGSFSFTAPEQLQSSADAGPAADLWSIGVLLHRMLTGEQPFTANDPGSVLAAILERPPPRLLACGVAPEIAAQVQPIVDRALQKRPEDRHPDAEAMQRALVGVFAALGAAPSTGASLRSQPAVPEFARQAEAAPLAEAELADDAPTPQPEDGERTARRSDRARSAAAAAPPSASRLPFGVAAVAGALLGWLSIPAGAADPSSAAPAALSSVATVHLSVEPETAEVQLDGKAVPRPERAAALAIEVTGPGRWAEIAAPGYVARTVELPVRGAAMLVRLERAAAAGGAVGEPQPADSAREATAQPAGSADATEADDLQIVREPPAVARPGRPARSAPTGRPARPDPTPSRPAQSAPAGGAPPPIRTAPY